MQPRAYIHGHATPIVTVQTSKFFSVTKNSNIAPVCTARVPIPLIERVLKIITLENFDGCTSCMPSSPKVNTLDATPHKPVTAK